MKTISRNYFLFFIGFLCLIKISGCDTPLSLGSKVNTSVPIIQNPVEGEAVAPGSYLYGPYNKVLLEVTQEFGIESVYMTYWYTALNGDQIEETVDAELDEDGYYVVNIDTTNMQDGTLRAQVSAVDVSGNVTTTTDLVYFVKNTPPQIELTLPKIKDDQFDALDLNAEDSIASNAIYLGSELMGIATDMYGIAADFPRIMMWPADYSGLVDTDGIPLDSDRKWGVWRTLRDDKGYDLAEEGLKAMQFRWPLFEPVENPDGTYRVPVEGRDENIEELAPVRYRVRLWVRDMFGEDNYYPNRRDNELGVSSGDHPNKYIEMPLVASVNPRVYFDTLPDYYNGSDLLQVRVTVSSSNEISSVKANITHNEGSSGFVDSITLTLNNQGVYVGNITSDDMERWLGSSTNGQKFVQVEAEDIQGNQGHSYKMITIDTQQPTLTYSEPDGFGATDENNLARVTSTVILRAATGDNIRVARLYYSLGVNATARVDTNVRYQSLDPAENDPVNEGWTDTLLHTGSGRSDHPGSSIQSRWGGTLSSFNWRFENIAEFCKLTNASEFISPYGNSVDNLWLLPLKFKVVDAAGNVAIYSTALIVDPDADLPVVDINSHTNFQIVGGQVRISGTATDNEMIYDVEIRVRYQSDNDCDSDNAPNEALTLNSTRDNFVSATVGTKSSMASWYYDLNKEGDLNPPRDKGHRRVLVEVRARDASIYSSGTPKQEGPINSLYLDFDNSVPAIDNVRIISNYGAAGESSVPYSLGARVAGSVTLEAKIRDDGGIKSIMLRGEDSAASREIINTNQSNGVDPWVVPPRQLTNANQVTAGKKYWIKEVGTSDFTVLQRGTNATNEKDSTFIATITAYFEGSGVLVEANAQIGTAQYFEYTLYIPLNTNTLYSGRFNNSAGTYTMDLQVDDNTSPMPYSSRETFSLQIDNYYPMGAYNGTLNAFGLEYSISGRAWDTGNNISVQGVERVVVYFSRPGNDVNDMVGTPIDLDLDAENLNNWAYQSQYARTGRSGTESSVTSEGTTTALPFFPKVEGNGTFASSSSGIVVDGNGWDSSGKYYQTFTGNPAKDWSIRFDTTKLKDGPLNVHYVVFDSAGNATHNVQRIYIANDRPRITNIQVGTDLNNDGVVSSDEYQPFTPQNYNSGYGEITTGFRTRNDKFVLGLNTSGGNGAKKYSVSYVTRTEVQASTIDKGKVYTIIDPGTIQWINYGVYETLGNYSGVTFTATNKFIEGSGTGSVYSYSTSSAPVILPVEGSVAADGTASIDFKDIILVTDSVTTVTGEELVLHNNRRFLIKVWDSTVSGDGEDDLSHTVLINVDVNNTDIVIPKIAIDPFYWNSISDNSLYQNSKNNGHIELENDLPDHFTASSGVLDRDPKVSGKISIRGTASDDNTLGAISFSIQGFPDNTTDTYYEAATFSGGTWTIAANTVETDGWAFNIKSNSLGLDGHEVQWQIDFDTSKVTGMAAADRRIRVIAHDLAGNPSSTPPTTQTSANGRTSNYKVDVVPYITSIETTISEQGGISKENIRSADGKYSIKRGGTQQDVNASINPSSSNFITVRGFNLNPSNIRIQSESELTTYKSNGSTVGTSVTSYSVSFDRTSFTMTNALDKSGYLTAYVNGIGTLNNINNNNSREADVSGDSSNGSKQENMPNREADRNTTKNITLTDDRYLQFYTVIRTDVRNGYFPVMLMDKDNPDNPVFGYVDTAGGESGNAGLGSNKFAGTFFSVEAQPQRTRFSLGNGVREDTEYLIKASNWYSMGMAQDDSGRYIHATTYNRDSGSFHLIYDRYAELHRFKHKDYDYELAYGTAWGRGTLYTGYVDSGGVQATDGNNNAIPLENNSLTSLLLDRYQYPKLIAKGNSVESYAAYYMSYYDSNSGALVFRNFRIGNKGQIGATENQLFDTETSEAARESGDNTPLRDAKDRPYTAYINLITTASSNTTGQLNPNNRNTPVSSGASQYFDMAVTKDNTVVLAYYNASEGRLAILYTGNAVNGSTPTTAPTWYYNSPVNNALPDNVGMHVSMVIDEDDRLHIAAFDSSDSTLKYIYIPNIASATGVQSVTVDQYGSVGYWTSIKLHPLTNIPYIAYYNAAETGTRESLKIAWAKNASSSGVKAGVDNNGYTTGDWEYRTVPALDPPQGLSQKFQKVNLDFRLNGDPVLGYLGDYIEFSYPVGE